MTQEAPQPNRSPRRAIVAGFVLIAACFGGFGTWAAVAPLASAVVAQGIVAVDSNRKKVQHLEGGVVAELAVRDGERVEAGQVLLRLDETRARAAYGMLRGATDADRAIEARLVAERDGLSMVAYPDELLARADESDVADTLRGQSLLFDARRSAREGQVAILAQRIVQLEEQIEGLAAQKAAKDRQVALIHEELGGLEKLFKQGHARKDRVLALQREAAELDGERGELRASIARLRTSIGETRLEVLQIDRGFREEVVGALRDVQTQLVDLAERLAAARHVVDHVEIRAPADGIVVGLDVHTVGGVVRAGETLLEIVPQDDRLIVEARLRPADIENLAVGHQAMVLFSAFSQRTLPTIVGAVSYVSADSRADPRTGEPYFVARIEIEPGELAKLGERRIQPGMPAEVMIRTGERTALQYLTQPFLDSINRAWREE